MHFRGKVKKFQAWARKVLICLTLLLCLLLHCSLLCYKRARSLGAQDYGTRLRQQRVLGSFNPFKSLIFLLSFVVVLLFLFLHKVLTRENIKVCLEI